MGMEGLAEKHVSRAAPENLDRKLPDRMLLVQGLIFGEQCGDIFVVVVCFIAPRSKPQGFISTWQVLYH